MAIQFLLDENQRGVLWSAIQRHNARSQSILDVVRVGDPADLPLGSIDPDVLLWAERENRVLITHDRRTMPHHLAQHLANSRHSPGIFIAPRSNKPAITVGFLVAVWQADEPDRWRDWIAYVK